MRVVVYQEKKIVREREREYHINLSILMNPYNMYIIPIQIYMHKLRLEKKQKTKSGCKRDFMERPLVNIYIYIYVLKF